MSYFLEVSFKLPFFGSQINCFWVSNEEMPNVYRVKVVNAENYDCDFEL